MKLKLIISTIIFAVIGLSVNAQAVLKPKADVVKLIKKNLKDAVAQYKVLLKNVPKDSLPLTFEKGKSKSTTPQGWVSGFYPGTLFYLYQGTKDKTMYQEGLSKLPMMEKIKTYDSHDIGFMMFDSYGIAYKIKPSETYKDILLTSAKTLMKRFNPTVGCTMSWGSEPGEFRVIIDNMMNLELLMWATQVSGDSAYAKVAISHANTTIKNHFRPDYSSYHLVNYNPETGKVNKKHTVQGYTDDSAWSRGQGWGLYGFTMMYRETKDKKYLAQAKGIADFILNNPTLPADKIPYWDFSAPGQPDANRDSSAGAIYASALVELAGYVNATDSKKYLEAAETMIRALSSDKYKAILGENGGFILKHGVGFFPKQLLVDAPLTYGDYYFVEAMLRYKNLGKK